MKQNLLNLIVPVLAAAALTSCQKDASVAPSGSQAVAFQLKATNTAATINSVNNISTGVAAREQGASIQWTAGTANVSLLKFEAKKAGSEVEFKSAVNQTIDLFNANMSIGNVSIPAGTYSEVEFKAQLVGSSTTPSLELKGQFTNAGVSTNIVFRATESLEVKGEKNNVTISDSTVHAAVTALNMVVLSRGISAAALSNAVKTNGEILITADINKDLYAVIVKNLRDLEDEEDLH
jgi:hypothetical protein